MIYLENVTSGLKTVSHSNKYIYLYCLTGIHYQTNKLYIKIAIGFFFMIFPIYLFQYQFKI